jgi:cell division topological specificity factor
MSFLDYFRSQKKRSAAVAKERLQIIVAHERGQRGGPDYLPMMQDELLQVIRRYVDVDDDAVRLQVDRDGDYEVLELNVTLPDGAQSSAPAGGG